MNGTWLVVDGKDVVVATGEQQYGNGDARHHTVVRRARGPAHAASDEHRGFESRLGREHERGHGRAQTQPHVGDISRIDVVSTLEVIERSPEILHPFAGSLEHRLPGHHPAGRDVQGTLVHLRHDGPDEDASASGDVVEPLPVRILERFLLERVGPWEVDDRLIRRRGPRRHVEMYRETLAVGRVDGDALAPPIARRRVGRFENRIERCLFVGEHLHVLLEDLVGQTFHLVEIV